MNAGGHIVSVVIPTVGRSSLASTRAALERQTRPPDEVVVSLDETRRGIGWARNEGIRRSRGDLVAFIDDDGVPPPDWIERLARAIDRHGAAGAGGSYTETDDLLRRKRLRRGEPGAEVLDTDGWVGNGGNVMYRREWLDMCRERDGYVFDESSHVPCAEDYELANRLRRRGANFVFVPNPVTHLRRVTPAGYLGFQFRRGRGIAHLFGTIRAGGGGGVPAPPSVLWGPRGRRGAAKWAAALWRKAIGPFDVSAFAGPAQFALFWIGEKFEGAGFVYETAARRLRSGRAAAGVPGR